MGRMLALAAKIYQKKRLTSRMLVVVTDGEDHESGVEPEAEKFRELGVSVYTAGIGRGGDLIPMDGGNQSENFYRDGSGALIKTKKNEDLLQKLSAKTGGFYIDITDSFSGLNRLLEIIETKERTGLGSKLVREKIDRTCIFIMLLVILLAAEMVIPERKRFYS
jgi:Ca-activated chloride channel family protein